MRQGPDVADVGVGEANEVERLMVLITRPMMPLTVALAAEATYVALSGPH